MKANELRIGDWVMDDDNKPYRITDINKHLIGLKVKEGHGLLRIEWALPIFITPQILVMAGFEMDKINDDIFYELKINENEKFFSSGELVYYGIASNIGHHFSKNVITCLHELQNFYFHVSGTELEIEL